LKGGDDSENLGIHRIIILKLSLPKQDMRMVTEFMAEERI
jgi:hypothetical protein